MRKTIFAFHALVFVLLCCSPATAHSQDLLDQLGAIPLDIEITTHGLDVESENVFLIKRANIVLGSEAGGGYSSWHLNFTSPKRVMVATERGFMEGVFFRFLFFDENDKELGEVFLPRGDSNRVPWRNNEPTDKYYYEFDIWRVPIQLLAESSRIDITRRR